MSLKDWKKQFVLSPPSKGKSREKAIEDDLLIFQGCLPQNLADHGCVFNTKFGRVETKDKKDDYFSLGMHTSNLCALFTKDGISSPDCPIKDGYWECYVKGQPFAELLATGDPTRIIAQLETVLHGKPVTKPKKANPF